MGRHVNLRNRRRTLLGNLVGRGYDRVKRLRLTARRHRGSLDYGSRQVREPASARAMQMQLNVQLREAGLRQGQRGRARKMLSRKVEQCEGSERFHGVPLAVGARHLRRRDEVLCRKVQIDDGVRTLRHRQIEDEVAVAQATMLHGRGYGIRGLSFAITDGEGYLLLLFAADGAEDAEVTFRPARSMGIHVRIEHRTRSS